MQVRSVALLGMSAGLLAASPAWAESEGKNVRVHCPQVTHHIAKDLGKGRWAYGYTARCEVVYDNGIYKPMDRSGTLNVGPRPLPTLTRAEGYAVLTGRGTYDPNTGLAQENARLEAEVEGAHGYKGRWRIEAKTTGEYRCSSDPFLVHSQLVCVRKGISSSAKGFPKFASGLKLRVEPLGGNGLAFAHRNKIATKGTGSVPPPPPPVPPKPRKGKLAEQGQAVRKPYHRAPGGQASRVGGTVGARPMAKRMASIEVEALKVPVYAMPLNAAGEARFNGVVPNEPTRVEPNQSLFSWDQEKFFYYYYGKYASECKHGQQTPLREIDIDNLHVVRGFSPCRLATSCQYAVDGNKDSLIPFVIADDGEAASKLFRSAGINEPLAPLLLVSSKREIDRLTARTRGQLAAVAYQPKEWSERRRLFTNGGQTTCKVVKNTAAARVRKLLLGMSRFVRR